MITYQRFMINARLKKAAFPTHADINHEHCAMCGAKFSSHPNDLHEGFVTEDEKHWICPACHLEFGNEYRWTTLP